MIRITATGWVRRSGGGRRLRGCVGCMRVPRLRVRWLRQTKVRIQANHQVIESYFRPQDPPHPTGSPAASVLERADPSRRPSSRPRLSSLVSLSRPQWQSQSRSQSSSSSQHWPSRSILFSRSHSITWVSRSTSLVEAIKNKYYELFRGRGAIEDDDLEDE